MDVYKKKSFEIILSKITCVFFSLRAICTVWLAFDSEEYSHTLSIITAIITGITLVIGIIYLLFNVTKKNKDFYMILIPIFFWILIIFNSYGGHTLGNGFTTVMTIIIFMLMRKEDKAKVYNYFYFCIQLLNVISIFLFLFAFLKIEIGFKLVQFYEGNAYYMKWFIFAILKNNDSLRLCGVFNEPGALGSLCALLLITSFKRKKILETMILVFTIILTFSLAGYLMLLIILIIYLLLKNWKNIVWVILIIIMYFIIPSINWHNATINNFVQRLIITENGLLGDNRTSAIFDIAYNNFIHTKNYLFGYGFRFSLTGNDGSSYKNLIVQFGIVGTSIYTLLWMIIAFKQSKMNKNNLILIFIFMISLYQRPMAIINLYGYIVLFGGIAWMNNYKIRRKLHVNRNKIK